MIRFTDADIELHEFVRLAALTGGEIGLPDETTAALRSEKMTGRYRYLVNHTPKEYGVPTRITFAVDTGFNALDGLYIDYQRVDAPRPTARAVLTTEEVADVLDVAVAVRLDYDAPDGRERPVRGTRHRRSPVRRRVYTSRQSGQRPSSR